MVKMESSDEGLEHQLSTRTAAILVEKLREFRQSYNRTHGQVCEFFDQAHVIEKIYHHAPGPSKTIRKQEKKSEESDNEDEDGCNEQKTWSIKQKLTCWRTVMREVVCDVCPNLQLENQPDINPGLMKHVLDEIRKLKTELAFQHNAILELNHQLENHQGNNQRKDRLIEKLLIRSREIRLEGMSSEGTIQQGTSSSDTEVTMKDRIHQQLANFDQEDLLQFGSIECLRDLHFDLGEMQSYSLPTQQESGEQLSSTAKPGSPLRANALNVEKHSAHDLLSHSLPTDMTHQQYLTDSAHSHDSVDANKDESVDSTINDDPTPTTHSTVPSETALNTIAGPSSTALASSGQERWNKRQAWVSLCGRLCCVYAVCKVMRRGSKK